MTSGEVVFSISDYAQKFIREYKNPKLDQNVIDAIVVDFINYFAENQCRMNLAMYTSDLRNEKKMSKEGIILQKEDILSSLNFQKYEYDEFGIIKSVNQNCHMNTCAGKAEANNAEAVELIEEFIKGYMAA